MNLILVSIGNFQEYILDNIKQLLILEISNIYVITNSDFFEKFEIYKNKINLISIETLNDSYNFFNRTSLDKGFRNGFWTLTSLRFFYIYEFMKKYDVKDVIHLENDVLIYYNCNEILNCFDKNYIYLPFDTFKRNIASIMFIPSCDILKNILDNYDFTKNDMENFSIIKNKTGLIKTLPIFPKINTTNEEIKFVSENFINFNFIFDAAAIGQFIGGVDPRNFADNSIGFVNETCIIKYNKYNIIWDLENNFKKPFLVINDVKFPIFNLHIHSKNLIKFM